VLIDTLVNRARSFIYSTALPPGVIGANRAAVELAQGPEGAAARQRLQENITLFRKLCPFTHSATAIQPVICGSSESALERAQALEEAGIYAPAIRYPSVARNSARLRITLSAGHSPEAISLLAKALGSS
jgi:7-keto-8-aminopelargonate synthetase-like enzyme